MFCNCICIIHVYLPEDDQVGDRNMQEGTCVRKHCNTICMHLFRFFDLGILRSVRGKFSVFSLYTYLYCFVVILFFMFCCYSCFVYFYFCLY
jgi:hypothetical protein